MGRLGYYSKLSGQALQESDPPPTTNKNKFATRQLFATSTFPVTHLIIRSKFFFLFIGREPAA